MKTVSLVSEMAVPKVQSRIAEMKAAGKSIDRHVPLRDFSDEIKNGGQTALKEMIGTDDGAAEFVEKATYDLYQGREQVELLYKPLYATIVDRNLPKVLTANEFGPVQVIFLKKWEGGEIKFGTIGEGETKVVEMITYAAGMEYDEDIVEYNETWRVSEIGIAFGEAYNKLLNHLHLSPIISGTYATTGGGLTAQKAAQKAGTAQLVEFATDLPTTIQNALTVLPKGSYILANSGDRFRIEEAISTATLADGVTPSPVRTMLSRDRIIYYDGETIEVGQKTYEYAGVTIGTAFIVVPKRNLREYVKHDLRVDSGDGDLSRLIVAQIVGRARRGQFVALGTDNGVVKVELE